MTKGEECGNIDKLSLEGQKEGIRGQKDFSLNQSLESKKGSDKESER